MRAVADDECAVPGQVELDKWLFDPEILLRVRVEAWGFNKANPWADGSPTCLKELNGDVGCQDDELESAGFQMYSQPFRLRMPFVIGKPGVCEPNIPTGRECVFADNNRYGVAAGCNAGELCWRDNRCHDPAFTTWEVRVRIDARERITNGLVHLFLNWPGAHVMRRPSLDERGAASGGRSAYRRCAKHWEKRPPLYSFTGIQANL